MSTVDLVAIDCESMNLQNCRLEYIRDRENLLKISGMLKRPILRAKSTLLDYFVLDGDTAYVFKEQTKMDNDRAKSP
jgi:hypothetical protein